MDIDKFIVTVSLLFFDAFLFCFTALILMIILDGIKEWHRSKKPKPIKPTVPKAASHE